MPDPHDPIWKNEIRELDPIHLQQHSPETQYVLRHLHYHEQMCDILKRRLVELDLERERKIVIDLQTHARLASLEGDREKVKWGWKIIGFLVVSIMGLIGFILKLMGAFK